ncbi:tRNA lysidine(34) synthetase TilS [Oceanobacillus bengalensis]|uniref:tRNA(Ile)-lysidine synthase n=1 Tax=Oceanobacillus bengalensis TaxID=1435466 RepID=A0A494YU94_9BACI|nr:tRNA lysidine(34) synthetase TilS [Oceanobacillus bengalensis]RKQ13713.1 tRNA lysidine(34) synthetase TilS [Oceanobacillus bengalensis]
MNQDVLQFIRKHQLLTRNMTVLVGVSGGPDSMALLHFLISLQEKWNLTVIAISVDHQLRGEESYQDLVYVKDMCEKWNVPFVGKSIDVPAYKIENKLGTEIAARELRYQFFQEQMKRHDADILALGHHGDDQIETMLMRLTRSATSSNFSGIPVRRPFHKGEIIRPFLSVTKADIMAYCSDHHIIPRIDNSNFDTTYTRNFFRKNILPLLKERNHNVHSTIQYLSETLYEDEVYLQEMARDLVKGAVHFDSKERTATFQIDMFTRGARALQRRAFHLILKYLYKDIPKDLSYVHEVQFFDLMKRNNGNVQIDFPLRLKVEKSYGAIVFYFLSEHSVAPSLHQTLDVPGRATFTDGSSITACFTDRKETHDDDVYYCNVDQTVFPLHIRTRIPGDRMTWKGLNGTKKIKDIFIDAKIPKKERDNWPILVDNKDQVLWIVGLKKGQPALNREEDGPWVKLYYEKGQL